MRGFSEAWLSQVVNGLISLPLPCGDPAVLERTCAERLVMPDRSVMATGGRASRVQLDEGCDPQAVCRENGFADALPVVPPTAERVDEMLQATPHAPDEIIGHIPPNYGAATVEKVAANAVMAGCRPEMMRVLLPLVRAACDEGLNLHGVQATTHFAAPLILINGPVRQELEFACGQNVFSNVARANSTLGREFQLILRNLGGARPDSIDMSTLGNPGKFSFCIAENEEASPWQPYHVERGLAADQSALSLMAAEPPRGVSEHNARSAHGVLRTISRTLASVWSYHVCGVQQALVVLSPEHARTIARDGLSKQDVRSFLFDNTGVPIREFDLVDQGEGSNHAERYEKVTIDDVPCYRKFEDAETIQIVVAGGTAGKFSAVLGGWGHGPFRSRGVTCAIDPTRAQGR